MKRKYAAMMLGLVLTVSSMNVYAADAASDTTAESTEESAEDTESTETEADTGETEEADADAETAEGTDVYGVVTDISEDGVTVSIGNLADATGDMADVTESADTEESTDSEEAADTEESAYEAEDAAKKQMVLQLNGEEWTLMSLDDIVFHSETEPQAEITVEAADAVEETTDADAADIDTETTDTETTDAEAADTETTDTEESDTETAVLTDSNENAEYQIGAVEEITSADLQVGDIVIMTEDEYDIVTEMTVIGHSDAIAEEFAATEDTAEDADADTEADTADDASDSEETLSETSDTTEEE
ncbi:MAG: hypothetical protein Q4C91_14290 [Eubacteriales bacterium]|nr:hypothetical protein [Eubacteriales bacterium]